MFLFHLQNALRSIFRTKVSSLVIVISIGLGIGVSTTMFSFYYGMSADPIPNKSDRLYRVLLDNWGKDEAFEEPNEPPSVLTMMDAQNLLLEARAQDQVVMYQNIVRVSQRDSDVVRPVSVSARMTSSSFFNMFEPPFKFGDGWSKLEDDQVDPVVVISEAVNNRFFSGANSIGQLLEINGQSFRIVGVLDQYAPYPIFYDMSTDNVINDEVFFPYAVASQSLRVWPAFFRSPVENNQADFAGRFEQTETVAVQYWVQLANENAKQDYLNYLNNYVNEQRTLGRFERPNNNRLYDVNAWIERQQSSGVQKVFVQTLVVIAVLFFVVCMLNIVTLLMSRFLDNAGQISLMRAMGAPKTAIFKECVLEVACLGLVGGLLGILLSRVGLTLIGPFFLGSDGGAGSGSLSSDTFNFAELLDAPMLLLAISLAIVGAVLVSVYPAWRITKLKPAQYLKAI